MLRRTTGCVVTAVALLAAYFAGPWLSGYALVTWLGIGDRVELNAGTYDLYWHARVLPAYQRYVWEIVSSGVIGFGVPWMGAVVLSWLVFRRRSGSGDRTRTPRFATRTEVRSAGMLGDEGLMLGVSRLGKLRWKGDGHLLLCTPSHDIPEAFLVSNLLEMAGSVVVLDNDARLWRATSGYRSTLGLVRLIRPFAADGRTAAWNPLSRLSADAHRRRAELDAIATMLYDDTRYGSTSKSDIKDAFIAFASFSYDDAVAQKVLWLDSRFASPTFASIGQLVSRARAGGKATIHKMVKKPFVGSDTRSMLDRLLGLTRRSFAELVAMLEPVLMASRDAGMSAATGGGDPWENVPEGATMSIYVAVHDQMSREQKRLAAVLLWDVMRAIGTRNHPHAPATVLLDGIERIGAVAGLPGTLRSAAKGGPRFVLGTRQPSRWRDVYGYAAFAAMIDTTACRVVQAPPDRTAENDFVGMLSFADEAHRDRTMVYDPARASGLATNLMALRRDQQLIIARSLPGPLISGISTPRRDKRLTPRLLPPATVEPAAQGDTDMPCPTLRAIGATAALALAASATTACSQDKTAQAEQALAAQAKEDGLSIEQERWLRSVISPPDKLKKPPPYSEALVPARLGPNTFNFPMNLYDNQRGPDFQGSVGLALRWPTLEAFPPGARSDPAFRAAYMDQRIDVSLSYIDKVPIDTLIQVYIDPSPGDAKNDPSVHINDRVRGEPTDGLTPFFINREKLRIYLRSEGAPTTDFNLALQGPDWYIAYSPDGSPRTFITCTPRKVPGARLIGAQLEDTPVGQNRGACTHEFAMIDLKLSARVTYLRAYLRDWKKIEDAIRAKITKAVASPGKGT